MTTNTPDFRKLGDTSRRFAINVAPKRRETDRPFALDSWISTPPPRRNQLLHAHSRSSTKQ